MYILLYHVGFPTGKEWDSKTSGKGLGKETEIANSKNRHNPIIFVVIFLSEI